MQAQRRRVPMPPGQRPRSVHSEPFIHLLEFSNRERPVASAWLFDRGHHQAGDTQRMVKDKFVSLRDIAVPESIKHRCTGFDEASFRDDISSTKLRLED